MLLSPLIFDPIAITNWTRETVGKTRLGYGDLGEWAAPKSPFPERYTGPGLIAFVWEMRRQAVKSNTNGKQLCCSARLWLCPCSVYRHQADPVQIPLSPSCSVPPGAAPAAAWAPRSSSRGCQLRAELLALPGHLCLTFLCTFTSLFGAVAPPASGGQDQHCAALMSLGCCLPGGSAGQGRTLLSNGKGKRRISDGLERKQGKCRAAGLDCMSWQSCNPIWLRSQLARVGVGKWLPFPRTF